MRNDAGGPEHRGTAQLACSDRQTSVPSKCREVRMVKDGEVRIADVQLPDRVHFGSG